jgi:hypothetical protein
MEHPLLAAKLPLRLLACVLSAAAVTACAGRPTHVASTGPTRAGESTTTTASPSCSIDATPPTSAGDTKYVGVADAQPPTGPPMTKGEAIAQARKVAAEYGTPEAPAAAPVRAVKMTWLDVSNMFLGADPNVAATRCIWVVTVHAPAATKGGPPGFGAPPGVRSPQITDVYTAFFDVGSHEYIGASFGRALPPGPSSTDN